MPRFVWREARGGQGRQLRHGPCWYLTRDARARWSARAALQPGGRRRCDEMRASSTAVETADCAYSSGRSLRTQEICVEAEVLR